MSGRFPKIPYFDLGTTVTGIGYATYNAQKAKNTALVNVNKEFLSQQYSSQHQEIINKIDQDHQEEMNTIKNLKDHINATEKRLEKLENVASSSNTNPPAPTSTTNNLLESNNLIPSWDDIINYFNTIQNYINSIPV